MPVTQTYPASRYEVAPLIDRTERERLSADAVRAFFNIMVHWKIRDDDARRLLGGMSNGAYCALKKGDDRALDEDKLRRISYLVGIFKALSILYSEELADRWMQLPNKNRIFLNMSECEFSVLLPQCLNRRLPDIDRVRSEVNAWVEVRNGVGNTTNWRFTTEDARIKLRSLYPAKLN